MIAEESGHVFSQVYAYLFVGHVLLRKGDFERSLPSLQRSFELCNTFRAKLLFPLSAATLGYAKVRLGETQEGLDLLIKAATAAERQAIKSRLSLQLTWLGEAMLLSGHGDQALSNAKRALQSAKRHGEIGDEAWTHWLLGEVFASENCYDDRKSMEAYLQALEIARSRQMQPLVGHVQFGLGRLADSQGDRRQSDLHFREAERIYRSLQMTYWHKLVREELTGRAILSI